VDAGQLRLNAAIAATVIWAFANGESPVRRAGAREVDALVRDTDLGDQMRAMGTWADWEAGRRGLRP